MPTFYYGGEAYTRIGVVSNGYVVIGGGTAADVELLPADVPERGPAEQRGRPVLDRPQPAGGAARNIRDRSTCSATGRPRWIIVDLEGVKNFSNATTHTGEIWIRIPTAAHGHGERADHHLVRPDAPNAGSPAIRAPAMNWGAENRDGSSGENIASAPANSTEYRRHLAPPIPGGSVTIPFDIVEQAGPARSTRTPR